MKTIESLACLLLAVLVSFSAMAQTDLPASGVQVFKPAEFKKPLINSKDIAKVEKSNKWGQNKSNTNTFWVVYSDRSDNQTYTEPKAGASKFNVLNFNEKVRIARIENGYALVYRERREGLPFPQISNEAESKGWIPMSKLLLWETCPVNENDIYNKALLAVNIDKIDKNQANKVDLGRSYFNPETRKVKGPIITDMTFYYVMKTDPSGLVLLSYQSKLRDASSEKNVLYGWVESSAYVPWNQRSCLEPNWNPKVVEEFTTTKLYHFYADSKLSTTISSYNYGVPNSIDKNYATKFRMEPEKARFPLLDNDTDRDDIYKVTSFGSAGRSVIVNSNKNNDPEIIWLRKKEQLTKQLQNINVILVIDGTKSMSPYFKSVKDAINKSFTYFDAQKYNIKVGAVIYRDYADGDAMIETQPLVNYKDPRLSKFLDNIGNKGYGASSSPADHTHTEALFAGIDAALDNHALGYNPEQANLMIVIGDCGNSEDDSKSATPETLLKKLINNRIQLMSHQVRRSTADAWQLFDMQMSDLITNNVKEQYGRLNTGNKIRIEFDRHPAGIGFDVKNDNESNFFIGSMRFAKNLEQNMNPAQLSNLIEGNIGSFATAIQKQIDIINSNIEKGQTSFVGSDKASSNSFDEAFLIDRMGKELYQEFKKKNTDMTCTGYAKKADTQNRPYWKPVVFLSSDELQNLMTRLRPVYEAADNSEDRRPYYNAVKGLLQAMLPDISDDELNDMDISEASKRIAGLNEASAAVKSYTLAQLLEPRAVPNNVFIGLVNDFKTKFERLQRIGAEYKYSYVNNGNRYYWIPIEDLP